MKRASPSCRIRRGWVPGDGTCFFWSVLMLFKHRLHHLFYYVMDTLSIGDLVSLPMAKLAKGQFRSAAMRSLNEQLRSLIADGILGDTDISDFVAGIVGKDASVDSYCQRIRKGELWGGDPEFRVTSNIFQTLVCVVTLRPPGNDKRVYLSCYGEGNKAARQCVFVLYDQANRHYSPLYLAASDNLADEETIFDRTDVRLQSLLAQFIEEDLRCK